MKDLKTPSGLYLIDANVFLRFLVPENKTSYQECVQLFSALKAKKIQATTSSIVLAEVQWTLKSFYRLPKRDVLESLQAINSTKGLTIRDKFDMRAALKLWGQHKAKFVDCLLASDKSVQKGETIIVSYDKEFDKLGVIRREPGDLL